MIVYITYIYIYIYIPPESGLSVRGLTAASRGPGRSANSSSRRNALLVIYIYIYIYVLQGGIRGVGRWALQRLLRWQIGARASHPHWALSLRAGKGLDINSMIKFTITITNYYHYYWYDSYYYYDDLHCALSLRAGKRTRTRIEPWHSYPCPRPRQLVATQSTKEEAWCLQNFWAQGYGYEHHSPADLVRCSLGRGACLRRKASVHLSLHRTIL